ncbi:MAG: hypothetical protein V1837_05660 [Candidatus Woesearchaeota archaeon]
MIRRNHTSLDKIIAGIVLYKALERKFQPNQYNLYGMTEVSRQGAVGDFEDTTDQYKRAKILQAAQELPSEYQENLLTKDYVAQLLLKYMASKEGKGAMKKYGLNKEDIRPAAARLEEGVVAATTKDVYPYPVMKNIEDRDRYIRSIQESEPKLSAYDVETMWVRHELRHLSQDARLLASASTSLENRLYVEADNIAGLFREYVEEMQQATGHKKEVLAAKARATLGHYLGTKAGMMDERGTEYSGKEELTSIAKELEGKLGTEDYNTLFNR